jgi:enamine deaminase RidA (YjgF/YER057c/UK114 family)
MTLTIRNPSTIAAPLARYSHAVEIPKDARALFISGQVGLTPDGAMPDSAEEQSENVWLNLKAILEDADMGFEDLVRVNAYITDARYVAAYRTGRDKVLTDGIAPASTLVVVSGLADPKMKIEVEAVAAKS